MGRWLVQCYVVKCGSLGGERRFAGANPPLTSFQAMEKLEQLESQLAQEHALRTATDNYLLELQQARQRAASCLGGLRDGQKDIASHCSAVKYVISRVVLSSPFRMLHSPVFQVH